MTPEEEEKNIYIVSVLLSAHAHAHAMRDFDNGHSLLFQFMPMVILKQHTGSQTKIIEFDGNAI